MKCGLKGKPCFLRRKQRWLQTALTATWYRVLIDIGIDMSYSFHLVAVFAESSSSALQLAVCMLLGSSGIGRQQWPKNTRSHGPHRSAIETDTRFWSIDQENKKGVYGILCGPSRDKKMIFCIRIKWICPYFACCIHQFVWMKYQDQVGPGTRILSNPSSRGASGDEGNRPGHNCNKITITSILRTMTTATTRCIHSSPPGPGHHGVASCYPLLRWKLLFSFIQTRINSFCTEPLHLC